MVDESRVTQAGVSAEGSLETSKLLRNTYTLLSLTLLFSALMAIVGMAFQMGIIGYFVCLFGGMGMTFVVHKFRNSGVGLAAAFGVSGLLGMAIGPLLNVYLGQFSNGPELVAMTTGMTAVIFLGLSGYVLTTGKDFSFMRGFLMAGLGVALIGVAVVFVGGFLLGFNVQPLSLALSALIVLLMCGFILYDTSNIINGGETNYIVAAVSLYTNIWVLFVNLLQLMMFFFGEE
jgi:modulator of FtsH protease